MLPCVCPMKPYFSLRPPAVKASMLAFAPEGWFSVRDYLRHEAGDVVPRLAGAGKVLELVEGKLPDEKTLSMRLHRYSKQSLLERRRVGHGYLYRVTDKGRMRGVMLKKHRESIFEQLLSRRQARIEGILRLDRQKASNQKPVRFYVCDKCGGRLSDSKVMVCPHCHKMVVAEERFGSS